MQITQCDLDQTDLHTKQITEAVKSAMPPTLVGLRKDCKKINVRSRLIRKWEQLTDFVGVWYDDIPMISNYACMI